MVFAEIEIQSDQYQQELELRNLVLRRPLGLNLYAENLENEVDDWHLGLWDGPKLQAVLVLTPLADHGVKMRQVAVQPLQQGLGLGRQLVTFAEVFARQRGFQKMELHARKEVVPFYQKLGYHAVGEEFIEVSIPHLKMEKML